MKNKYIPILPFYTACSNVVYGSYWLFSEVLGCDSNNYESFSGVSVPTESIPVKYQLAVVKSWQESLSS